MPKGSKVWEIDKYVVQHSMQIYGQTKKYFNNILCYSAGSYVGSIRFYQRDQLPQSKVIGSNFYLHFEFDRYQEIIETLRYEKPLSVFIAWDDNDIIWNGYVISGLEPIGEQEGIGISG